MDCNFPVLGIFSFGGNVGSEILRDVFPLLDCRDLVTCMLVCKHWQAIAQEDYIWKCLCAKKWPSICKRSSPLTLTYHNLFKIFYGRQHSKTLIPPRLSFDDLEFYIDIWAEQNLIFSEVVPGYQLQTPTGICDALKFELESSGYKITLFVDRSFNIPVGDTVSISVLIGRKDSGQIACIINKSVFDYIDWSACHALAFDDLEFSPAHPFVSGIRAWISLLFMDHGDEGALDGFGIELDFCDAADSKDQVLWLLDMLDWT